MIELAALALADQTLENARKAPVSNGVAVAALDRAIEILRTLQRGGEDPQDFILREYILDRWLHGYLPLSLTATDPALFTWRHRHTGDQEAWLPVGCWGPEATEFATSTMLGQLHCDESPRGGRACSEVGQVRPSVHSQIIDEIAVVTINPTRRGVRVFDADAIDIAWKGDH